MVRYYSNIVANTEALRKKAKKLGGTTYFAICSTHGPVWTENIAKVIGIYESFESL